MLPKTANGRQPNSRAVVAGNNAEAIVLDLMQHWPFSELQIDHFVMAITSFEGRVRHITPHQTA
jgi:hypothetical protein